MQIGERGACPRCGKSDKLMHVLVWGDAKPGIGCDECVREVAKTIDRVQLCDNDPEHGRAWRNPFTRRNEYLCARCHVESGDGVVQNRWARVHEEFERVVRGKPVCAAKNAPGASPCWGGVKPRGVNAIDLCNAHAGAQSSRSPL